MQSLNMLKIVDGSNRSTLPTSRRHPAKVSLHAEQQQQQQL
jgi:hypothetical protein